MYTGTLFGNLSRIPRTSSFRAAKIKLTIDYIISFDHLLPNNLPNVLRCLNGLSMLSSP